MFSASLAGLPPCNKALGYFLRCIKRVYRQYVIGSSRDGKRIVLFPLNSNGTETTMMHCGVTFDGAML